eukprot:4269935-Prymnesium_polylepis.1
MWLDGEIKSMASWTNRNVSDIIPRSPRTSARICPKILPRLKSVTSRSQTQPFNHYSNNSRHPTSDPRGFRVFIA